MAFLHFTNSLKLKLLATTNKANLLTQRRAKPSDPCQSAAVNNRFSHKQGPVLSPSPSDAGVAQLGVTQHNTNPVIPPKKTPR